MAQLINLKLSRNDRSSPWGFRLQGGKDFGTPLLIQKVNFGSLAEKAGLQVGDALVRVNGQDVYDVKHKDAQDVILGAGNAFELTIQRGGTSTWKPSVTPIGPSPVSNHLSQSPQLVTKTSLAKVGPQSPAFGSSHNSVTRPFSGALSPKIIGNGYGNESGSVKAIVNKQYNTPVGIYSEENIAETLTAQAEVLAGGVLGVNFKKNEKNYEANKSEVFKMVQEADKEPRDLETEFSQNVVIDPIIKAATRHVSAPEPKAPQSASNQNICADCERLIVGVFVRIKDKSLHVECFKCATCGSSLKNVGYYSINNKLYCDIHAKMVARQNPPAPSLEPVTVPPGCQPPLGSFNIIPNKSKDVHSLQSPQPSTISPLPFHAPKAPSHVNAPNFQTPPKVSSNVKPYEAPKQTPTTSTYTGGYNQVHTGFNSQMKTNSIYTDESKYSTNSKPRLPFLKPKPPSAGSAFCPVISTPVPYDCGKRASLCSQEVCRTMAEFERSLNDPAAARLLIDMTKNERPQSPVPDDKGEDFASAEATPRGVRTLLPRRDNVGTMSPSPCVTFPPEIPSQYRAHLRSPTPEPRHAGTAPTAEPAFTSALKTNWHAEENAVVARRRPDGSPGLERLPRFHGARGPISTAMEIAPERPFTPVAVTGPVIKPAPWISLPADDVRRPESPLVAALQTAPERSYSPLPSFVYADELVPTPVEHPDGRVRKTASATDASSSRPVGNDPVRYMHGYYNNKTPVASPQTNKTRPVPTVNSDAAVHKPDLRSKPAFPSSVDKSFISGPCSPIEIKSDCNEICVNRVPDFKGNDDQSHSEYLRADSEQNVPFGSSQYQRDILSKPQQSSTSNEKSISNRTIGPGIKNKVSTFTSNTSISNTFLNQPLNKAVPSQDKKLSSITQNNNNNPNAVKLIKAVPFFSNSTSLPSSP